MSAQPNSHRRMVKQPKNPGIYRRGERYVAVYDDRKTGKQRKRSFSSLREAREFKGGLTAGQPTPGPRVKLRAYAKSFLNEYNGRTGTGLAPNTRASYADAIERVLVPRIGNLCLEDIGPPEVKRLSADLSTCSPPSSVRRYIAILKVIIATAHEDGVLFQNRIRDVRTAMSRADYDKRSRQLTKDQTRKILQEIPEEHYDLVYTLAATGMRIGEALGMCWGDVIEGNDGATVIHVRRETTKSHAGVRALQLTARMQLLRSVAPRPVIQARTLRCSRLASGTPWTRTTSGSACSSLQPSALVSRTLCHTCCATALRRSWLRRVARLAGLPRSSATATAA